jgi:hypothetical protein
LAINAFSPEPFATDFVEHVALMEAGENGEETTRYLF